MRASTEDIQWLRILDLNVRGDVPEFNASRLIAMGFVEKGDQTFKLTGKGKQLLAANPRTSVTR